MRFFSGNFFPLATLSSIEDHMPFSSPSLLCGRSLFFRCTAVGPRKPDCRLMYVVDRKAKPVKCRDLGLWSCGSGCRYDRINAATTAEEQNALFAFSEHVIGLDGRAAAGDGIATT